MSDAHDPRRCPATTTGWHEFVGHTCRCGARWDTTPAAPARRPMRCEVDHPDGARCESLDTVYVMGRWMCAAHRPAGSESCTHTPSPTGLCPFCGATVSDPQPSSEPRGDQRDG